MSTHTQTQNKTEYYKISWLGLLSDDPHAHQEVLFRNKKNGWVESENNTWLKMVIKWVVIVTVKLTCTPIVPKFANNTP